MNEKQPYRPHPSPLLRAINLEIGYTTGRKKPLRIAGPLSAELYPGQLVCLLGPNGSGKSTLLRTLAGLQQPLAGNLTHASLDRAGLGLAGLRQILFRPSQLARQVSLVLTEPVRGLNLDVYSLVALGRYPYSGWLGRLRPEDRDIIDRALDAARVREYKDRKMAELSDGESQKVMLARALAQDTPLMMLDEPTAHLDLPSRIQLIRLLHELGHRTQKSILVSTHELDLALQVADQVWLMQSGSFHCGTPEDLVLNGIFEEAFDREGIHFDKHSGTFPIHTGESKPIRLQGEDVSVFWTRRALRRLGYSVRDTGDAPLIQITSEGTGTRWRLLSGQSIRDFDSIGNLLKALQE
jgi:iron complex transport system ATP-binding protein